MYDDTETIPPEENFTATKMLVDNKKKISTPGPIPKHWLVFSYISSEYYELDQNFDDRGKNQTTHLRIKLNFPQKYCGN